MEINTTGLNKEQEKAAFCGENAVIAAGAGSGKTRVLANRFIWLLTEKGYKVDEILTLTFTRKAAAEMFRRIYFLVQEIASTETGLKAQRAREAIDNFIHARIQTFDSYSNSIVRQCSPRYGLSPDFQLNQERSMQIALEVSYPFFIANRNHPAIKKLYANNRPNDIASGIFAEILFNYCRIDKQRDFTADIKKQFNIICVEWEKLIHEILGLLNVITKDLNEDKALFPKLIPILEDYQNTNAPIPQTDDLKKYFDFLLSLPLESVIEKSESHPIIKTIEVFLYRIEKIANTSMQGGKQKNNSVKKNIYLLRELFETLLSLSISCIQAGFIISIKPLVKELETTYLIKKRAEGILTYSDISNLARTILIEQKDIRQSEKDSFKAIMIDEFQDNNESQKDILFLLAEKHNVLNEGVPSAEDLCNGKLFFVGDEKQSIYAFRGADVSVFRKLKQELKGADLPLKTNYRSAPHLIAAFNTIFGGSKFDMAGKAANVEQTNTLSSSVFAQTESLPLYEASYAPLEAGIRENGKTENTGGKLSVCILNSDEDSRDSLPHDENEAGFVAKKIKQLLNEKTKDGDLKYKPHDIAVLFRKTASQWHFEKHFRILGIPYTCESINNLFFGGLVNDIMSVLRLVSHPFDSLSYAEMLRSPYVGLSTAGTALCLSLFCAPSPISNALPHKPFDDKPLALLDEPDKTKYRIGQKIYSVICQKAQSENISSLVNELWLNLGYSYETQWSADLGAYREMFDYLFHLAAEADKEKQTLASFTDLMSSEKNGSSKKGASDSELPLERPSAVRITTIHKSKGLEYPVVFLCGCGQSSKSDRCEVVYFSDETGIVFSPPVPENLNVDSKTNNFFWKREAKEKKRKRTAELRRLLYVGMTRAETELYITGSLKIKNTSDTETEDFSLKLKQFITEQSEKSDNYIESDTIWNNDTLFGLLLPSIVSHIPDEGGKNEESFFCLEEIPVFPKNFSFTDRKKEMETFLKRTAIVYEKAEVIKTPVTNDNHLTPTSLKNSQDGGTEKESLNKTPVYSNDFSGIISEDIFIKVDSLFSRYSQTNDESSEVPLQEKFNYGTFGTIAHICVEALLKKQEPVLPSNIAALTNSSELTILIDCAKELAVRFV
ncbi:MAG: UvrD-helicase domain-containing protein, partial [Treponema sp.]|nr:UvrD-helicase domain-containing protein [Treponema sp.]